jgi:outer membrane protein assembly factor BamB
VAGTPAAVELWRPTDVATQPEIEAYELPQVADPSIGIPGRPTAATDDGVIYLPSASAPVVFSFDARNGGWLRGSDDPIRLYAAEADALMHASLDDAGVLWVTSFNTDQLFAVDPTCDAILGSYAVESTELLAGPHGVQRVGDDVWVVLAHANSLVSLRLDDE